MVCETPESPVEMFPTVEERVEAESDSTGV